MKRVTYAVGISTFAAFRVQEFLTEFANREKKRSQEMESWKGKRNISKASEWFIKDFSYLCGLLFLCRNSTVVLSIAGGLLA